MKFLLALSALCLALSFAAAHHQGNDEPVQIVVFTETLCPGCQNFLLTAFNDAIKTPGIEKIANITVIEYGNAHETKTDTGYEVTCQHGARECEGNLIATCAHHFLEKAVAQQLLVCFATHINALGAWDQTVATCEKELNIDLAEALECSTSDLGAQLIHEAAQQTTDHQYVPWIEVNGEHTEDIQDAVQSNLVAYACSLYTGHETIPACAKAQATKFYNFEGRSYNSANDFLSKIYQ